MFMSRLGGPVRVVTPPCLVSFSGLCLSVSRTRARARYLMDWDKGLNDRLVGSLTRAWYGQWTGHCYIAHPILPSQSSSTEGEMSMYG